MTSKFVDIPIPPLVVEVEKWQLCFFAKAVGETNPIYFDEAAAKAAGHPSILAPPTYAVTLSLCESDPYARYRALGIDWCTMMHAQQRFDYFAPFTRATASGFKAGSSTSFSAARASSSFSLKKPTRSTSTES